MFPPTTVLPLTPDPWLPTTVFSGKPQKEKAQKGQEKHCRSRREKRRNDFLKKKHRFDTRQAVLCTADSSPRWIILPE